MIEPMKRAKAKRVIETQSFHDDSVKRTASPRQVLFGTWRGKNAKPSTPVVYSGLHYKP